jgi:lambda repressor-like predicted transcriptional regulator
VSSPSSIAAKAAIIRGLAALHGKSLADIQRRSGVHHSVFYRVVRGERTSRRLDRFIAKEIGVTLKTLVDISKGKAA